MGQSAVVDPKDTPTVSSVQSALEKARQSFGDDDPATDDLAVLEGHPATEQDDEGDGDQKPKPDAEDDKRGPKGDEDEKGKGKYKSVEDAEKAAKSAERRMHTATEEAANLRKELEATKSQLDEMQKKVVERTMEISEEANEEFLEKVLSEMQELDPMDPAYRKSLAKLYRKMFSQNEKVMAQSLQEAAKQIVQEELATKTKEQQEKDERLRRWELGIRLATSAGFDMQDTGTDPETGKITRSDDYLLFWRTFQDAPNDLDYEEQVDWTIKELNRILGRKVSSKKKQDDDAKALQNRRVPLGKGSAGPARGGGKETPAERPSALIQSALDKARERRRI